MTDTTETTGASSQASLTDLRMPELQALAGRLGITGISKMRKPQLVEAIRERRRASGQQRAAQAAAPQPEQQPSETARRPEGSAGADVPGAADRADGAAGDRPARRGSRRSGRAAGAPEAPEGARAGAAADQGGGEQNGDQQGRDEQKSSEQARSEQARSEQAGRDQSGQRGREGQSRRQARQGGRDQAAEATGRGQQERDAAAGDASGAGDESRLASIDEIIHFPEPTERAQREESGRGRRQQRGQGQGQNQDRSRDGSDDDADGDDDRSGRRRRGRDRYRDRKRRTTSREASTDEEVEIGEDDVLIPVAGILDILENYAFVRTTGYLPGASDVYVSLGQVKKAGLRRGDAVTGAVRQPREGEGNQRQKFNALVRLDSVNGTEVEESVERPDIEELTPVHPQQWLRLETTAGERTGRVLDLLAPIGRGQRVLLRAPRRAGTTTLLQHVAQAVSTNHPEAHLMVVLLGERPEEVTATERAVAGEVIASTFDRAPVDHTTIAELAIERAQRLVELGQDVVVLLDSLTTLVRAYDATSGTSGRVVGGAVDAEALQPVRRLLGAARKLENGGSLTLVAAALSGSTADDDVLAELSGAATAEIVLDGELAAAGFWPAVDVAGTGTLHTEALLGEDELAALGAVRSGLGDGTPRARLTALLDRVGRSSTNAEMLLAAGRGTR